MIKQFGIMLNNIGPHQQGLCINRNMELLVKQSYEYAPIIFYSEYGIPYLSSNISMMQDIEAWDFPHPVIANDISTVLKLINCPLPTKKMFYIWDLEWLYNKSYTFDLLKQIYLNEQIELISRSLEHDRLITKLWKKPIAIIEDFKYDDIITLI